MARRDRDRSATPLLDWGDQLRATKRRRQRVGRRIAITGFGIALLGLTIMFPPSPRLVWNASASAPVGFYRVTSGAPIERHDMVIAWIPERFRRFAAERRYLPATVPLVKRVAALAGDEICALDGRIFVNGRPVAVRRDTDRQGRAMPIWSGCIRLHGRQLFLLMDNPASFDGRYFGATEARAVIGKARLLWRR
ncbi:S26 family signal peptidase [Sphingomonas sp. Root710]|uniref:S26 family signal peptidase n=1 Tax=Sphingomonas sp. Root710 TaxID=1736594 RepID=UPI0006FDFAAD|nr:S26 family signal peptidase [Sphingomonas sp. Root710]KRB82876.1 S26 family signal peptidase [Sphingomonas sp. Root710]